MGFFFLFVAAWATYGLYRVLRSGSASRAYLQAAHEPPLQIAHLAEPLRSLAMDTRLLRVSLEAPLREMEQYVASGFDRSADDIEAFDNTLRDISRQLTDWVMSLENLPESERHRLADAGVSAAPIRQALEREGWSFERRNLLREGMPAMDARLRGVMQELAKVEAALQVQATPYR